MERKERRERLECLGCPEDLDWWVLRVSLPWVKGGPLDFQAHQGPLDMGEMEPQAPLDLLGQEDLQAMVQHWLCQGHLDLLALEDHQVSLEAPQG